MEKQEILSNLVFQLDLPLMEIYRYGRAIQLCKSEECIKMGVRCCGDFRANVLHITEDNNLLTLTFFNAALPKVNKLTKMYDIKKPTIAKKFENVTVMEAKKIIRMNLDPNFKA